MNRGRLRRPISVVDIIFPASSCSVMEIREIRPELVGAVLYVAFNRKDPTERMAFNDVKDPARLQETGNNSAPLLQIGKPMKDAVRSKNDVESLRQFPFELVNVRHYKISVYSGFDGQRTSQLDRIRRKIYSRDLRTLPSPRQGIEAKVTLQMEKCFAGNVTKFLKLNPPKRAAPCSKALETINVVFRVHLCHLVPVSKVHFVRIAQDFIRGKFAGR